jgi:polysaccharide pyruvyl transferase WcaK-like protein
MNTMSTTLKVLHVASFMGNIGDNANHCGMRSVLAENLGCELAFTELEIRKCYANYAAADRWAFDDEFVDLANAHDLVLVGGGNYFELRHSYSSTGTTIDITPERMAKIKTPLVFNALGCDVGAGVTDENVAKFGRFLDAAMDMKTCLVSLRNDGAMGTLERIYGKKYSDHVYHVADGGFFTRVPERTYPELPDGCDFVVVNAAVDMEDVRFPGRDGLLSHEAFCTEFADVIGRLLDGHPTVHLLFAPHMFSDLKAMSRVMDAMPDHFLRDRVSSLPMLHGQNGHDYVFGVYQRALFSMGFRFHSNVCPVALGTPSIGLVSYPQVAYLYEELGMPERAVRVNRPGFGEPLGQLIDATIAGAGNIRARYADVVRSLRAEVDVLHKDIAALL